MTEENIAIAVLIAVLVAFAGFSCVYLPITILRSDPDWVESRKKKKRARRNAARRKAARRVAVRRTAAARH